MRTGPWCSQRFHWCHWEARSECGDSLGCEGTSVLCGLAAVCDQAAVWIYKSLKKKTLWWSNIFNPLIKKTPSLKQLIQMLATLQKQIDFLSLSWAGLWHNSYCNCPLPFSVWHFCSLSWGEVSAHALWTGPWPGGLSEESPLKLLSVPEDSQVPPLLLAVPKDNQVPPLLLAVLKDSQLCLVVSLSVPLRSHY